MEFETGIPIPKPVKTGRPGIGWQSMSIGDSVLLKGRKSSTVRGLKTYLRKRYGFAIVTRTVEGGIRVWRTA